MTGGFESFEKCSAYKKREVCQITPFIQFYQHSKWIIFERKNYDVLKNCCWM